MGRIHAATVQLSYPFWDCSIPQTDDRQDPFPSNILCKIPFMNETSVSHELWTKPTQTKHHTDGVWTNFGKDPDT